MFIAALFTIGKKGKQPKCPSMDDWIRKICIYTQWNTTQPQKKQNNAICSIMDGIRDSHPE